MAIMNCLIRKPLMEAPSIHCSIFNNIGIPKQYVFLIVVENILYFKMAIINCQIQEPMLKAPSIHCSIFYNIGIPKQYVFLIVVDNFFYFKVFLAIISICVSKHGVYCIYMYKRLI